MRTLRYSGIALLAALALAACGGGGTAHGRSPTATLGPRPSSPAKLAILSPRNGAVIHGSAVHVRLSLKHAIIVRPTTTHIVPNKGHVHLLLDGRIVSMNNGLNEVLHDVKPGTHQLQVQFVASDHLPFDPPVIAAIVFEAKR